MVFEEFGRDLRDSIEARLSQISAELEQEKAKQQQRLEKRDGELAQIDVKMRRLSEKREELAELARQRCKILGERRAAETKSWKKIRTALRQQLHAKILLETLRGDWSAEQVAETLRTDAELVLAVRQRYESSGLEAALETILAPQQQQQTADWFAQFGEDVIAEVRRRLRKATEARATVSPSDVAASVWGSFLDNHLKEVDFTDPESALVVLAQGAKRHCEKWNRYATNHSDVSRSTLRSADSADGADSAYDPVDPSSAPPEVCVMLDACLDVLQRLGECSETPFEAPFELQDPVRSALRRIEGVDELSDFEDEVLALKLAGRTLKEIASLLRRDYTQVKYAWRSIKTKLTGLGG